MSEAGAAGRGGVARHFRRHIRFYLAALGGVLAFALAVGASGPTRILLGGDVFFLLYLALLLRLVHRSTPRTLRARAASDDEGLTVILGLTFFAVIFVLTAVFLVLNDPRRMSPIMPGLAILSAPLVWAVVHLLLTFHYADLYYSPATPAPEGETPPGDADGLEFPGTREPGIGDFAYHAFVIGMTSQVSDVDVSSRSMRRTTLAHGIFAFFYNTVLIALAVNAAVTFAT